MWPGRLTALGALGARPDHYSLLTFAGRHFARRFSELLSAEIPGANGYYLSIGPATQLTKCRGSSQKVEIIWSEFQ